MKKTYNSYDHRLKILAIDCDNLETLEKRGIPKTTLDTWQRKGIKRVFTLEEFDMDKIELINALLTADDKVDLLEQQIEVLNESRKIFNILPNWKRFKSADIKEKILNLYNKAKLNITADSFCKLIDISSSRLKAWQNKFLTCELEDYSSCPKSIPSKINNVDLKIMEKIVKSIENIHIPITNLAIKAMKEGLIYYSPSTWLKYVKEYKWRRPKFKIYTKKNDIGYRANKVNESWHIDISIMKLMDGTKVYIQAIIDNFSRYIIAHKVFTEVSGKNTKELLTKAIENAKVDELISDAGVENINKEVQVFSIRNKIDQIIAQIDIEQSNSMIEAFFRSLKNNYLYFTELRTFESLERKVEFYVNEHNNSIPHAGIKYCIPVEIYNGKNIEKEHEKLKLIHKEKRKERIKRNKELKACIDCPAVA